MPTEKPDSTYTSIQAQIPKCHQINASQGEFAKASANKHTGEHSKSLDLRKRQLVSQVATVAVIVARIETRLWGVPNQFTTVVNTERCNAFEM
ncbi:hypothetical protein HDU78_005033, partial [Chytriomyces hyalinus]